MRTEIRYTEVGKRLVSESFPAEVLPYHYSDTVMFELPVWVHPTHGRLIPHVIAVTGPGGSLDFPWTACVSLTKEDGEEIEGASFYDPREVYA